MNQLSKKFLVTAVLIALQMGTVQIASAQVLDIDPENGESYLRSSKVFPMPGYTKVQAEIRATDNFGLVRTREVQMDISGNAAQGNRKVIARRYEPECLRLAGLARMNADQVCDNLTVTGSGSRLKLAFSSIDANKRYSFNLQRSSTQPNQWQALRPSTGSAPELSLTLNKVGGAVDYVWSMSGVRNARYYQHGQLTQSWLTEAGVSDLEGSLFALGDVLNSFNAWEFEQELYPRDHPEYKPTPYLNFGDETTEGGCIFGICFGNLDNSGSGGGNTTPGGMCDKNSPNYTPDNCPWDLTYATWPVYARAKIWKINNDQYGFSLFLKNNGTGPFRAGAFNIGQGGGETDKDLIFTSLKELGSSQPLVTPGAPGTLPYGASCHREGYMGNLFTPAQLFSGPVIQPDAATPFIVPLTPCTKASGRPPGRYRLFIKIDPANFFDSLGYGGNNTGDSGVFDWINLKN